MKPPQPLTKFSKILLDCTKERDVSAHKDIFTSELSGSENCLHLNVYTPRLDAKLPVMVFLHGGGFSRGSGNSDLYSPEFLVQEGVVVVTLNYRLGPLGFLSLPQAGLYGNYGLKDQQLALMWVNENIKLFGGDPTNVTLFGESAGGSSVNLHILNERSRKLFHKAICQSGVALNDWVFQIDPEVKAVQLAKLLGAKSDDPKEVLEVLMKADYKEITAIANQTMSPEEKRRGLPMPFRPTIEVLHKDAFITESPVELMKRKDIFKGIPIITGINSNEGIITLKASLTKIEKFNTDMVKYIPR